MSVSVGKLSCHMLAVFLLIKKRPSDLDSVHSLPIMWFLVALQLFFVFLLTKFFYNLISGGIMLRPLLLVFLLHQFLYITFHIIF